MAKARQKRLLLSVRRATALGEAGNDLQQPRVKRFQFGLGEVLDLGHGVADRELHSVGGGVQHETNPIGQARLKAGALRR